MIVQALFWSSCDPLFHPDIPDMSSSSTPSSPGQHLKLQQLMILVLDQKHLNTSFLGVHGIHAHLLEARTILAQVVEMAAFI